MARINLKPWREELRSEQQKDFLVAMAAFAIVGVLYIFVGDRVIGAWTENQRARNGYLSEEITKLDKQIIEIQQLQQKRDQLIERMRVIQELQGNRPVIVHIFDELVRQMPDGVYFTSVARKQELLEIKGKAESNNRISSLMRRLDGSDWFDEPNLTSVRANEAEGKQTNDFDLSVKRSTSEANGEEG